MHLKTLLTVLLLCFSLAAAVQADEFFGDFSGQPKLEVVNGDDGRPRFRLLEAFSFTGPNGLEWEAPEGEIIDGASIPQAAWSIVGGPLSGRYLNASIIHDRYCVTRTRTAHDTHRSFYYGMRAAGVSKAKADVMYLAVRIFGPSWILVKREAPKDPDEVANKAGGIFGGALSGIFGKKPKPDAVATVTRAYKQPSPPPSEQSFRKFADATAAGLDIEELDQLADQYRRELGAPAIARRVEVDDR